MVVRAIPIKSFQELAAAAATGKDEIVLAPETAPAFKLASAAEAKL